MVLVENPPGAAPALRSEVILMVASINDRIDEVGDWMSWIGGYGDKTLSILACNMLLGKNVHLPPIAMPGGLCSEQFAGVHINADGLLAASLEVHAPVIPAVLENGLSNEVNMADDACANCCSVRLVTNRVVILQCLGGLGNQPAARFVFISGPASACLCRATHAAPHCERCYLLNGREKEISADKDIDF